MNIQLSKVFRLDETGTIQLVRPAKLLIDYLSANWNTTEPTLSEIVMDSYYTGRGAISIRFFETSTKPDPLNTGWSFWKYVSTIKLIMQAPYYKYGEYPDVIQNTKNEIERLTKDPKAMSSFGISAITIIRNEGIQNYNERKRYKDPIRDYELSVMMIYSQQIHIE